MDWEKLWKFAERGIIFLSFLLLIASTYFEAAAYLGWKVAAVRPTIPGPPQPMIHQFSDAPIWVAPLFWLGVSLLVLGVVMVIIRVRKKEPEANKSGETPSSTPKEEPKKLSLRPDEGWPMNFYGMYCGQIYLDLKNLQKGRFELTIRAFNASNRVRTLGMIDGVITYFPTAEMRPEQAIGLPRATILHDQCAWVSPWNTNSEAMIVLEQSLPTEVAGMLWRQLAAGERPCLKLNGFSVFANYLEGGGSGIPTWFAITIDNPTGTKLGRIDFAKTSPGTFPDSVSVRQV